MATIIDKLVVQLGLDPSAYKKGQQEVGRDNKKLREDATKTARELEEKGKQAAMFFAKIKKEVLGLATVLVGGYGFKSFVEMITMGDAATGRLAKNLSMTTQDLSAWEGVIKRAGGSASEMADSIKAVNGHLQNMSLTGTDDAIPFLVAAHVNLKKFYDQSTPMTERLLDLATAFHQMKPAKAQQLGSALGLNYNTVNLLEQGRGAVADLLEKQRKLNVVSEEDARRAIARQQAWANLIDQFQHLGRIIFNDVSPAIVAMLKKFNDWTTANRQWIETGIIEAIRDFARFLKSINWSAVGNGIKNFGQDANTVAGIFGGWKNILEAIFLFWTGAKVAKIIAAIGKVAAASKGLRYGATAAGGAASGLLGVLGAGGTAAVAGVAGLFYSPALNAGEDAELAKNMNSPFALAHRLPKVPPGATAAGSVTNNTSSTQTYINSVNVYTQAKDGPGVAQALGESIKRHAMASQADTGMR